MQDNLLHLSEAAIDVILTFGSKKTGTRLQLASIFLCVRGILIFLELEGSKLGLLHTDRC